MSDSWKLRDAVVAEREAPYTFYRPSDAVLSALRPGNFAKLAFDLTDPSSAPHCAERMWVKIGSRDGDSFTGTLDNEPVACPGLKLGDVVQFQTIHIIDTDLEDLKARVHDRYFKRCLVSRQVLDLGRRVDWMYREEPRDAEDSGWHLFAGDESDDYVDDPANLSIVAIGVLLNRDASLLPLLESPVGSAFERSGTGFHPVRV